MNSGFSGADVAQLRLLSGRLKAESGKLREIVVSSSAALLAAEWTGNEIDAIRENWKQRSAPRLTGLADALHQMGAELDKQALQQEQASGASAGSAIPFGDQFEAWVVGIIGGIIGAVAPKTPAKPVPHEATPKAVPAPQPTPAPTTKVGGGPPGNQDYKVAKAIELAKSEVGTSRPTGYNKEGECIKSVQRWINISGGRFIGGGVVSGYVNSGAIRIDAGDIQAGDVIQYVSISNPDAFVGGVHTVMVTAVHPDGSLDIIQSNSPGGSGLVSERKNWKPSPPNGFESYNWRFGQQ